MTSINSLSPSPVWTIFSQICSIPHPSKQEQALRTYLQNLANNKGLETQIDEVGNLLIRKPATAGLERLKTVVLQGHIDMVPQKNADSTHNFDSDPIETKIEGDWLTAKGTTLGADNGLGVAAGMAIMLADDIPHGPIELLCTVEEETSMRGAFELKSDWLKGEILLNMDTEDEGELYIGCAGGVDINAIINLDFEATPADHSAFEVAVRGLKGGHSGLDIDKGRGNANQIINRFLMQFMAALDLRVTHFNGGTLRNAIPRESFTTVIIPTRQLTNFKQAIETFSQLMKKELGVTEPDLNIYATQVSLPERVIALEQQKTLINAIAACVSAPFRMSDQFANVVETSNNLAIVKSVADKLEIKCLTRSLINSARDFAAQSIAATFQLAGAETGLSGAYPGWKPDPNSFILKHMISGYEDLFGKTPAVKVIHAGLECGLFGEPYPTMDMISFGPTIRGAHSPDERCHIPSVEKFWRFLCHTLANIPRQD